MNFFQRHIEVIVVTLSAILSIAIIVWAFSITEIPENNSQGNTDVPVLTGKVGDTLSDGMVGVTLRSVESDPVDTHFSCARFMVTNISDDEVFTGGYESLGMVKDDTTVDMILGTTSIPASIDVDESVQVSSCFDIPGQEVLGSTVLFNITGNDTLSWEVNTLN